MGDVFGNGDDSGWEGLSCPPLDEFALNFDVLCYDLDGILDDPLLESVKEQDSTPVRILNQNTEVVGIDKKAKICYGNNGKGKQLKLNSNMIEIMAFHKNETREIVEPKVKKRRIMDCYDCQSMQQKKMSKLNHANRRVDMVDRKRKADADVKLEDPLDKICKPMQRKYREMQDHTNQLGAVDDKMSGGNKFKLEAPKNKLRETSESISQPKRQADLMRLDCSNQFVVVDNKMHNDYNSRYEATRRKLHMSYEREKEAKQQKQVQVINFQQVVMEQSRCRVKTKGKNLQQKLMARRTHKSN
ncbi:hypothetical protein DCAR_0623977 [Daucus carota subsp. sativus]|uniref:Uncharacterized protein n=1 Tax=Daucus carota subsp. sativus TaxID=79200 RepID=A0A164VJZ6_DAUCS|nr:hypothetical protein DCAR_0623977 [Daucus carota subsp. sativus]